MTDLIDQLECESGINECLILGPDAIWFERDGIFEHQAGYSTSVVEFKTLVNRILDEAGIHVHMGRPFASGRWRRFRIHVTAPPITREHPHITLRHHPEISWSPDELEANGMFCEKAKTMLVRSVTDRENILLIGPTGCGKTTAVNSLLTVLAENERCVIIEDCDEIHVPNKISCKLLTRDETPEFAAVHQMELVKQSLRMRPERLIVGEIRGTEAKDYLLALASGHNGALSTLHATCARQAVIRLEMLIQLGAPQWSLQAVRHLVRLSLQKIVVMGFQETTRKVKEIYGVAAVEETGLILEKLYP